MMKNKKELKKIEIEWKDTTFYNEFYELESIKECGLKRLKTIGYLIEETKENIKIAMTQETTEEDNVTDVLIVPKVNIINKFIWGKKKNVRNKT